MEVLEELPWLYGCAVEPLRDELDLCHIVASSLHVNDALIYGETDEGVLEVLARDAGMVFEANNGCKVWVNLV